MKKLLPFIPLIGINVFFIFFIIHKNSRIVELSFEKQHREKEKAALLQEQTRLQQKLCIAQNVSTVHRVAHNMLAMEKIKPSQLKLLPSV